MPEQALVCRCAQSFHDLFSGIETILPERFPRQSVHEQSQHEYVPVRLPKTELPQELEAVRARTVEMIARDGNIILEDITELTAQQKTIESLIRRADTKPSMRDASRDVTVHLKKEKMVSPEFLELWDKIKQKTTYRVKIDERKLIRRCVAGVKEMEQMRGNESMKIQCGKAHFRAIGTRAELFGPVKDWKDFKVQNV